jgi:hypothetical protein
MQHSALVLSLEKEALQSIRASLALRHNKQSTLHSGSYKSEKYDKFNEKKLEYNDLSFVKFEDFAPPELCVLSKLPKRCSYIPTGGDKKRGIEGVIGC